MRRRSILFVSLMNGGPWGGSEELWFRTALLAATEGHDVGCAVYAWEERRPRLDALRDAGAHVFVLPNDGHRKRGLREKIRFELSTRPRRRRALASLPFEQYDVVVLSQAGWQDVALSEWRRVRLRLGRYVLLFHNFGGTFSITRRRRVRLAAWVAGATANLFAADPVRLGIEEQLGIEAPRTQVLLNPISFAPPEQPLPFAPGPPWRFAVLAALDVSRKAQDVLLHVLAQPEWRDRPFELSLYGAGPDEARLAGLVRDAGLSAKVRLEGHTTDVLAALTRAHVVLQLTRIDAMPISVVEAMAAGRPVAVTPVGDMPAWVRSGETGWISAAATPDAIAQTLDQIWASRSAWSAMGQRAHRAFRERCPVPAEERLLRALVAAT